MSDRDIVESVAYALAKTCADHFGDVIPENFDTGLSETLAVAAIAEYERLRRPSASPEALEAARRITLARVDALDSLFEQDAVTVARALLSLSAPEDRA